MDKFKRISHNASGPHIGAKIGFTHNDWSEWLTGEDQEFTNLSFYFATHWVAEKKRDKHAKDIWEEIARRVKKRAEDRMNTQRKT